MFQGLGPLQLAEIAAPATLPMQGEASQSQCRYPVASKAPSVMRWRLASHGACRAFGVRAHPAAIKERFDAELCVAPLGCAWSH